MATVQAVFLKILLRAISLVVLRPIHGRLEGFFPVRSTGGVFQGRKSGEICFFPLKTKKTTVFAKKFKFQGTFGTSLPPFRRPRIHTVCVRKLAHIVVA